MKNLESMLKNLPKVKIRDPETWMRKLWERIEEYERKIRESKRKKTSKSSKR